VGVRTRPLQAPRTPRPPPKAHPPPSPPLPRKLSTVATSAVAWMPPPSPSASLSAARFPYHPHPTPSPTTLPAISCSKNASPCFSHVAHRITTTTRAATRNSPMRNREIATKIWIKNTERERQTERTSARERHVKTETLSDERAKRATWAL